MQDASQNKTMNWQMCESSDVSFHVGNTNVYDKTLIR